MRTKGKLEHNDIKGWELWIGADYHIADVHGKALSRHANVEHIINCWNAFEPDGLVKTLVGALEKAHLDIQKCHVTDIPNTEVIVTVMADIEKTLAEYRKAVKK